MSKIREITKTREEAQEEIKLWADIMEVDTDRDFFADVVDQLTGPVRRDRMTFNDESEEFSYQLIKPVKNAKGELTEIVIISECDFEAKKVLQKYKDNESIDSAQALISKYTDLPRHAVGGLKDRDIQNINAVVLGFFVQAASGTK